MDLATTCGECGRKVVTETRPQDPPVIERDAQGNEVLVTERIGVQVQLADGSVQHDMVLSKAHEELTMPLERPPCLRDSCTRRVFFDQGTAGFRA